ncbi:TetR/AcrR family transcriptional regulator [Sporosalibacterium faouarense]|uniref:TetR/AcrR family transcriptional regulator n=1 Tax=Sporosalibacterium faouarense TaxID=516123 RepID=UPI00141C309E|nr:TetR/AcrR family transcriptional regulator [Sporosalibacterium faouarense]MTI47738.1 TetR/AcrR family transcriptional regulator [Bacillota bacterium]
MQIQKEEVKSSIINSGKEEFYKLGYGKASLRRIVKNAGTTIGNFYNYFENKEELFSSIVDPAYSKFYSFINQHTDEDDLSQIVKLDRDTLKYLIGEQLKIIDEDVQKALVILIDGSQGTKYENIKTIIEGYIADHFMEHVLESPVSYNVKYYRKFALSASNGFVEGFLDILRKDYTMEEKQSLITDYILFFTMGSYGLLNGNFSL